MKRISLYISIMLLGTTLLNGAPARGGLRTYTQADGSTFQATLNGDAAFHWMQSNGEVILYNPQDKNYYIAELNSAGKFIMSKNKVGISAQQISATRASKNRTSQMLDSEKKAALRKLQRESRKGSHPR